MQREDGDFADDNPDVVVTLLRFANILGTDIVTPISKNLSRPLCPSIFGFDPLLQFVEEDDVVRAVELVTRHRLPGVFNVAGRGRLPWSEVASICGTRLLPSRPSTRRSPSLRSSVSASSTFRPSSKPSCATAAASTPAA